MGFFISLIGQGQRFCLSVREFSHGLSPCFGLGLWLVVGIFGRLFGGPGCCFSAPFPVLVQITKLSSSSPCQRRGLTSTSWWHRLSQRRMCKSWGQFLLLLALLDPRGLYPMNSFSKLSWKPGGLYRKHPWIVPPSWLTPDPFQTSKMLLFTLKILDFFEPDCQK